MHENANNQPKKIIGTYTTRNHGFFVTINPTNDQHQATTSIANPDKGAHTFPLRVWEGSSASTQASR